MIATDGVVTLRAPQLDDSERIVAERDEESFRWFGPGGGNPAPVACVWVDDELVGWVDYDRDDDHDWLRPGEVNVGYALFPAARGKGYASRAVELLLQHLARDTEHTVATLLIHPENTRSLAVARRLGFAQRGEVEGEPFFARDLR
ncbi:MAG: GNAT family N-acetyltransferase [Gaiellaceae bacterium]